MTTFSGSNTILVEQSGPTPVNGSLGDLLTYFGAPSGGGGGSSLNSAIRAVLGNWNPTVQFPNVRTAYANVVGNTGRCPIGFIGDSTTEGTGSIPAGAFLDSGEHSSPAHMASSLASWANSTVSGSYAATMGDGNITINGSQADTRVTFAGGAGFNSAVASLFGGFGMSATSSGTINFAPGVAFDHIRVCYSQVTSFTVGIDGGTPSATHATNDSSGNMTSQVWAVSHGTHTVNIKGDSGGNCLIQSIECYDSTAYKVEVFNGGFAGGGSGLCATATTGGTYMAGALAEGAKLVFINMMINDGMAQMPQATWQANITAAVAALQAASCDVVLVYPPRVFGGALENVYRAQYESASASISSAYNVPTIDLGTYYPDWSTQNAKGWQYDGLHGTELYYTDIGAVYAQVFLAAVGYLAS